MKTAFSRKLRNIPYLYVFLIAPDNDAPCVIGWGHKTTADKARRYAARNNLPYIALEDGFLRSLDLSCKGAQPLSLVVDHTGIYYDAGEPSDLENLLNASGWETPELMDSARCAMRDIIRHNLSKYSHAPDAPQGLWEATPTPRVLVLDQTVGDASVTLGGADEATFQAMLEEVLTTYPLSHVRVKTHPDVIAGKKRGYLRDYAAGHSVQVIAEDYAPLSLLAGVDVVYTVTSQMGFEALIASACHSMPDGG